MEQTRIQPKEPLAEMPAERPIEKPSFVPPIAKPPVVNPVKPPVNPAPNPPIAKTPIPKTPPKSVDLATLPPGIKIDVSRLGLRQFALPHSTQFRIPVANPVAIPGNLLSFGIEKIQIVDPLTARIVQTIAPDIENAGKAIIAPFPDGKTIAISVRNAASVTRLPFQNGGRAELQYAHNGNVRALTLSRNGERIAVGNAAGQVRAYDAETGRLLPEVSAHPGEIIALNFADDNSTLVSLGGGVVQVSDLTGQRPVAAGAPVPDAHPWIAVDPDSKRVLLANSRGLHTSSITDLTSWSTVVPLDVFQYFEIVPGGRSAVSAINQDLFVWDLPGFALQRAYRASDRITGLAVSTDGRRVYLTLASNFVTTLALDDRPLEAVAVVRPPQPVNPPLNPPVVKMPMDPSEKTPPGFANVEQLGFPFVGEWDMSAGKDSPSGRMRISKDPARGWSIRVTYSRAGRVIGTAGADDVQATPNSLTAALKTETKPLANWPAEIGVEIRPSSMPLLVRNSQLQMTSQVGVTRSIHSLTRAAIPAKFEPLLASWEGYIDQKPRISLVLSRYSDRSIHALFQTPVFGKATVQTVVAPRVVGNEIVFEFVPATNDEPLRSTNRISVRLDGGQARLQMHRTAGQVPVDIMLTREGNPYKFPDLVDTPADVAAAPPVPPPAVPLLPSPPRDTGDLKNPPADDKVAEAIAAIQKEYAKEYGKKTKVDRLALSETLLRMAKQTKGNEVDRYAMFLEARDLACFAAEWGSAIEIMNLMFREYRLDPLSQRDAALKIFAKSPYAKETADEVAEVAIGTLAEALAADRFDLGESLIASGSSAATKGSAWGLLARFKKLEAEWPTIVQEFEAMKKAKEKKAGSPDDPAANLDFGRYVAIRKNDWALGLGALEKAGGEWSAAAKQDLADLKDSKSQKDVGDSWWSLADKESGSAKAALLARAAMWYRRALPEAGLASKAAIADRLKIANENPVLAAFGGLAEVRRLKGHNGAVTSLYVTERKILSGGNDGSIRTWDTSGKYLGQFQPKPPRPVSSFSLSTSSNQYLAVFSGNTYRVYDASSLREMTDGPETMPVPTAFWIGNLFCLPRANGRYESRRLPFTSAKSELRPAFPDNAKRIDRDDRSGNSILVTDAVYHSFGTDFSQTTKLDVPDVVAVAFFNFGASKALISSADRVIRVLELGANRGTVVAKLEGSATAPVALAISPNNSRAISADGNIVRVWDLFDNREIGQFTRHTGDVLDVKFTSDGRYGISASSDGTVRMWLMPDGRNRP